MKTSFSIEPNTLHLWWVALADLASQEEHFANMLSPDELQRAERLRFPLHRTRFIIARGVLRQILGLYTGLLPNEIKFEYGDKGKPVLKNNVMNLQFNVSHSEELAIYGLTIGSELGVDVQKIETKDVEGIAKRFFSVKEVEDLMQLPENDRAAAFYKIWVSKEALIKAVGAGLYVPLGDFSVNLKDKSQWVNLSFQNQSLKYYIEWFSVHPNYQAAYATDFVPEKTNIEQWIKACFSFD